jgi:hypothetical protein
MRPSSEPGIVGNPDTIPLDRSIPSCVSQEQFGLVSGILKFFTVTALRAVYRQSWSLRERTRGGRQWKSPATLASFSPLAPPDEPQPGQRFIAHDGTAQEAGGHRPVGRSAAAPSPTRTAVLASRWSGARKCARWRRHWKRCRQRRCDWKRVPRVFHRGPNRPASAVVNIQKLAHAGQRIVCLRASVQQRAARPPHSLRPSLSYLAHHSPIASPGVPVGFGAGKVTKLRSGIVMNVYVEPQRSVHHTGTGSPVWQILTAVTFQFPNRTQTGYKSLKRGLPVIVLRTIHTIRRVRTPERSVEPGTAPSTAPSTVMSMSVMPVAVVSMSGKPVAMVSMSSSVSASTPPCLSGR